MTIKNMKGFGVLETITLCAFVVFLIVPLFTYAFEKTFIKYSISRTTEIADSSIISAVSTLKSSELSKSNLEMGSINEIEAKVLNLIQDRNIDVSMFDMDILNPGEYCPWGNRSDYKYIHLLMEVNFKRRVYTDDNISVQIHRDLEIPINR